MSIRYSAFPRLAFLVTDPLALLGMAKEGQSVAPPAREPVAIRSAAYRWLDIALEATAREHERANPRPTVGSRMLAIVMTASYDAWAADDAKAVGTLLGGRLRRGPGCGWWT